MVESELQCVLQRESTRRFNAFIAAMDLCNPVFNDDAVEPVRIKE